MISMSATFQFARRSHVSPTKVSSTATRGAAHGVARLTLDDLDEISSLRVLLEQFVVVRVQERWNPAAERRLRDVVAEMQKAAASGDVDRMRHADETFHEILWELAEHKTLLELAARLRGRINSFLRAATLALSRDELEAHAASHAELLNAIGSGAPRKARKAMETHITIAAKRVHHAIANGRRK